MIDTPDKTPDLVYARLLKAALECFLADEYHKVTTRMIADKAEANISMIRYYFGNKEGLYEEMIRNTMKPILDILDSHTMSDVSGVTEYLRFHYDTIELAWVAIRLMKRSASRCRWVFESPTANRDVMRYSRNEEWGNPRLVEVELVQSFVVKGGRGRT